MHSLLIGLPLGLVFEENHEKFVEKGNKSAGARARKAIGGIKKLVTDYRKSSVDDSKV